MSDDVPSSADRRAGTRRIAIVGHGLLATAITNVLRAMPTSKVDAIDGLDQFDPAVLVVDLESSTDRPLLVSVSDGWDCRPYERIQEQCSAHEISWLPVRTELARAVIGPLYTPGESGCYGCAELRRSLADDQFAVRQAVRDRYPRLVDEPSMWLTVLTGRTVAALTADEVRSTRS